MCACQGCVTLAGTRASGTPCVLGRQLTGVRCLQGLPASELDAAKSIAARLFPGSPGPAIQIVAAFRLTEADLAVSSPRWRCGHAHQR